MDEQNWQLVQNLISKNYAQLAEQQYAHHTKQIKQLLSQRQMPKEGWNDAQILHLMQSLSIMDSNNFAQAGIGEREGRVFSSLVRQRHYHLSHGIGRSGDIAANQPKAAGSSLLQVLTNQLVLHALKCSGATALQKALCIPMCTGMTLSLVMQTWKSKNSAAKYVIFPRIDQQSVLKSIHLAGLIPLVVEPKRVKQPKNKEQTPSAHEDALETDVEMIESLLQQHTGQVLCVLSTTSCFAPRLPDRIVDISKLCYKYNVYHLCNNAYGVQSSKIMNQINTSLQHHNKTHRLDIHVQSTDKNFMVPVGGCIVASVDPALIDNVAQMYAGRASASPSMDLLITLLSMGQTTWQQLLNAREHVVWPYFLQQVQTRICTKYKERILETTARNHISFALTLDHFDEKQVTEIGSRLFYRAVTGPRVVARGGKKKVAGIEFVGYGAHCNDYPHNYLTMACALGITKDEVDTFLNILDKVLGEFYKATS